jgi:hypothetical protein
VKVIDRRVALGGVSSDRAGWRRWCKFRHDGLMANSAG